MSTKQMTTSTQRAATNTRFLPLNEGRIAYDDTQGPGPLVVLVHGIGDLRAEYRFVAPKLGAAGYRVVTMDLRGHGESDATFSTYSGEMVARDTLALIRHLDAGPAVIVGNSVAAGSAVSAAAEAPELVSRIVLVGGFTRDPVKSSAMKLLHRTLLGGPWRTAVWMAVHNTLFPLRQAADHHQHRDNMRASLRRPDYSRALGQMFLASHAYAEARYDEVRVPSLFVMGTGDDGFADPVQEATEVSEKLGGETMFIEGGGHYPQVEAPELFTAGVLQFLNRTATDSLPLQRCAE